MAGGRIIGIRNYFFFDQYDHQYTLDADTVLQHVWDPEAVLNRLKAVMERERYDFILTHLPIPETHGHHKSATILALRAVQGLPVPEKPVILGAFIAGKADTTTITFAGLPGYPETQVKPDLPPFTFDRTRRFGFNDRLNYQIVVNWLIAEHKTQGTMQLLMNRGDLELFWLYALNPDAAVEKTRTLFERLQALPAPSANTPRP